MTASSIVQIPTSFRDRLAGEMRTALLPQRFPFRRDLELAGSAGAAASACPFYGIFWLPGHLLALYAGRIAAGGLAGALRAGVLQAMLRGCLQLSLSPDEALAFCTELYGDEFGAADFDLNLVVLDMRDGGFASAGTGQRIVHVAPAGDDAGLPGRLPAGRVLWLAAGTSSLDGEADGEPDFGMEEFCGRIAARLSEEAALVGVLLRNHARQGSSYEFSLVNDPAAVGRFASGLETILTREAVPEAVGIALQLAMDELLTNTISYGYADGSLHEILVTLDIEGEEVVVTIRDDGRAFDPLSVPEPSLGAELEDRPIGGLGIHFVRSLIDEVSYAREKGWNVLRLRKRFEPSVTVDLSGG